MDVTDLVSNWLRVEHPEVASLGPHNILIGLRPGKTSLHVGDSYLFTLTSSLSDHRHSACLFVRSSLSSGMVSWADVMSL